MVAREHVGRVVARYCGAETGKDRDAWLARFTRNATVVEADGTTIRGVDALRTSFDAASAQPEPA